MEESSGQNLMPYDDKGLGNLRHISASLDDCVFTYFFVSKGLNSTNGAINLGHNCKIF